MYQEIHPLQICAQGVIKSLYSDYNLPVTQALISYTNRQYARLEDILDALDLHSKVEIVQKFCVERAAEIDSARDLITKIKEDALKRLQEKADVENAEDDLPFSEQSNPFSGSSSFSITKPGVLRKFSVDQIETCFSLALEQLTGEKLKITLNDLQFSRGPLRSVDSVNFNVKVAGWSKLSDLRE